MTGLKKITIKSITNLYRIMSDISPALIIVVSIGLIYYGILLVFLRTGKNKKNKIQKNIVDSQLNDNFVNKLENQNIESDLTNNTSILDEIGTDHEQNDLLDQFKNVNSDEQILNSQNQNDEKSSNESGFRVIKNDQKKQE